MAPEKLTDYERRRLENIKRNEEMLAALKGQPRVTDLSASSKRQRINPKSYKVSPKKKPKTETPIVTRRSLRSRGIAPDSLTAAGLKDKYNERPTKMKTPTYPKKRKRKTRKGDSLARELGPTSMRDACSGTDLKDRKLIDTILDVSKHSRFSQSCNLKRECEGSDEIEDLEMKNRDFDRVELASWRLEADNIVRVLRGRILSIEFFPCQDRRMVVVGNKFGDVGFCNANSVEDTNEIYVYHPHPARVSGIVIQPFSMSKMFTCCYDGFIRLMDVEKEMFNLVYSGADSVYSIAQQPSDVKSLYFSEGQGELTIWDERAGKSLSSWGLHEYRINSIDFSACNTNIMATGSSDGTACIWDLRKVGADKPEALNTVYHKRAVHSAYFSPSGSILATTSFDDTVGLSGGVNYENLSKLHHNNQTGRWISSFRGIWGWDDSYIFIGNMKRGIDVISTAEKRCIDTLLSPQMSAIPCRYAVHPGKAGMLAGATSGGQVYIWT